MHENQSFRRKVSMCKKVDEPRRNHKYAVTDTEYEKILSMVNQNGFDKPRDFMVFLSEQDNIGNALTDNRLQQMSIRINSLATYVNMIEAGIDVERSQVALQEGVKQLCRDFRL